MTYGDWLYYETCLFAHGEHDQISNTELINDHVSKVLASFNSEPDNYLKSDKRITKYQNNAIFEDRNDSEDKT